MNRFSYVQNNPIRYTDPTGHVIETPDDLADYYCTDPTYCQNGDFKLDPYVNRTGSGHSDNSNDILDPVKDDEVVSNKANFLQQIREDPSTPFYADAGQVVFGLIMETGGLLSETGWGAVVFFMGYIGNRTSAAVGLYSTYYQYNNSLNGVTGTDAWVTTSTALIGTFPPASELSAVVQLVYDGARLGGMPSPGDLEFPTIPFLDNIP